MRQLSPEAATAAFDETRPVARMRMFRALAAVLNFLGGNKKIYQAEDVALNPELVARLTHDELMSAQLTPHTLSLVELWLTAHGYKKGPWMVKR